MASTCINVNGVLDAAQSEMLGRINTDAQADGVSLWVSEQTSRLADPGEHDARLAAECAEMPALVPIPVLLPPSGERSAFQRALRIVDAGGCRVVRLCPFTHRYPLVDWVLSPIPEICERHSVSLLLDFDTDAPRWAETVEFARRYPALPMVVFADRLECDRAAPPALDATPNLLLQVTRDSPRIEQLVHAFGAARFVYGSATSDRPDFVLRRLSLAALGDDDRAAIFAGNAAALADGTYAARYF